LRQAFQAVLQRKGQAVSYKELAIYRQTTRVRT
jgi:hypothetical protein